MCDSNFIELKTIFMELLNEIAPLKSTYLRANYFKFMPKELSNAKGTEQSHYAKNQVVKSILEKRT